MRKNLILIMIALLVLTFTGCSDSDDVNDIVEDQPINESLSVPRPPEALTIDTTSTQSVQASVQAVTTDSTIFDKAYLFSSFSKMTVEFYESEINSILKNINSDTVKFELEGIECGVVYENIDHELYDVKYTFTATEGEKEGSIKAVLYKNTENTRLSYINRREEDELTAKPYPIYQFIYNEVDGVKQGIFVNKDYNFYTIIDETSDTKSIQLLSSNNALTNFVAIEDKNSANHNTSGLIYQEQDNVEEIKQTLADNPYRDPQYVGFFSMDGVESESVFDSTNLPNIENYPASNNVFSYYQNSATNLLPLELDINDDSLESNLVTMLNDLGILN